MKLTLQLFVVLCCIALAVGFNPFKKLTEEEKEEREAQKKAKREEKKAEREEKKEWIKSKKHRNEVDLIYQRLDMMQQTVDATWALIPFIPEADVADIKELADPKNKLQPGLQAVLDDVIAKINDVVAAQEEIEAGSEEAHTGHRDERQEEKIIDAISNAVKEANIDEKELNSFKSLHVNLIAIHNEFKLYEKFVKEKENIFMAKMFPRSSDCYWSIQSGIYDVCSAARKTIYEDKFFSSKEIKKISNAAQKNVIAKINKGLELKDKDLHLSKLRDALESEYRKHYVKIKKQLDAIIKYLTP